MKEQDRKRFAVAMLRLATGLDVALIKTRTDIYFEDLADEPFWAVEWALKEANRRFRFFPKVVEIRELAGIAPRPQGKALSPLQEMKRIPDLMPVEEQRARLREMSRKLNEDFGTSFEVDESRGRPEMKAGCGRG